MSKKVYKKLVRDNIPEIIRAEGKLPVIRTLTDDEYVAALTKKLQEEVEEFTKTPNVEELADIKEVIIALRQAMGIHAGTLEEVRRAKANKNGRFKKRIYLESVD